MIRGSGLLVHISELPSKYGIGTFDAQARKFVRFLVKSKQKYWQLLPLNPTSYGDSPYQSFSAFALNPYFIDLDVLVKKGYLSREDLKQIKTKRKNNRIDYGSIYSSRFVFLRKAYSKAYSNEEEKINKFVKKERFWIEDYAVFMTIKSMFNGSSFQDWPLKYRKYSKRLKQEIISEHNDTYCFYLWVQYEAYRQYLKLKKYANKRGIKIIGDMPIYVALDSCDVWANKKLFLLDKNIKPTDVAGVPPDFFSATGQLWGNPIYNYEYCKKTNYRWWKRRFKSLSKLYDVLRIDHFRGFESYWSIKYGNTTAIEGKWNKGPGYDLFDKCSKELEKIEIIAEDLGIITDEVKVLKDKCGFPGLKVYQFAFEDYHYEDEKTKYEELNNPFLPHNYEDNCVAYIGTHDNDVQENFINEHPELHEYMLDYLNINNVEDIHDTLIGSLMRSKANVVIFMPQDLLKLGVNSRINTPGEALNNWTFRFSKSDFNDKFATHLKYMVEEANR